MMDIGLFKKGLEFQVGIKKIQPRSISTTEPGFSHRQS